MLFELTVAYRKSAALFAFVESKAPLYLNNQAGRTVKELAQLCNIPQDKIERLCNYMQSLKVLEKKEDMFYLTEPCLSLSNPNSFKTTHIKFELNPAVWNAWSQYSASLTETNSKSAFEFYHNEPLYDYFSHEENHSHKMDFDNLMAKMSEVMSKYIITSISLNGISSIIDIGGGLGSLAKNIKMHYPDIQCHVMDQYDFTRNESEGITFINGDFFSTIPSGYDAYCLKNVLHNWPDNRAINILKNCHDAMSENSVLYIIEMVKEPNISDAASFDLYMDIMLSGKARYQSEFQSIAEHAGLTITNIQDLKLSLTGSRECIIEMKKQPKL
ncbi:methyltransferase [Xenorhabdus sp. SGI240]|uniref:methyltransferase n=1 Tax=Xenorhabdus sp. SGI240 TaxID=3158262 RepID=UPI0032B7D950